LKEKESLFRSKEEEWRKEKEEWKQEKEKWEKEKEEWKKERENWKKEKEKDEGKKEKERLIREKEEEKKEKERIIKEKEEKRKEQIEKASVVEKLTIFLDSQPQILPLNYGAFVFSDRTAFSASGLLIKKTKDGRNDSFVIPTVMDSVFSFLFFIPFCFLPCLFIFPVLFFSREYFSCFVFSDLFWCTDSIFLLRKLQLTKLSGIYYTSFSLFLFFHRSYSFSICWICLISSVVGILPSSTECPPTGCYVGDPGCFCLSLFLSIVSYFSLFPLQ
jgi:hypothetical protein